MTINFEVKTGSVETTAFDADGNIVPAIAQQNDVLLTDGNNTYFIERNAGKAEAGGIVTHPETEETISDDSGKLIITQYNQVLKKYKFDGNTITPAAITLDDLVNKLNDSYFII